MATEKKYIEVSPGIKIEVDVDISQEELDARIEKWKAACKKSNDHEYQPNKKIKNYNLK